MDQLNPSKRTNHRVWLDEVPRKRRRFLEAFTIAAAKATLAQASGSELAVASEAEA